ncbi:MAG: hypothetical protein RLZZ283_79 [Candidatus Parcubacteria bacterium]|jgi:hypothetical protein
MASGRAMSKLLRTLASKITNPRFDVVEIQITNKDGRPGAEFFGQTVGKKRGHGPLILAEEVRATFEVDDKNNVRVAHSKSLPVFSMKKQNAKNK